MTATQEAQYTQQGVYLSIATPLGPDTLLLRTLHGEERLSGLFRFQLEMAAQSANLSFEDLVGQSATVSFALGGGQTRYLNGIIRRFYQAGTDERFTTYHAELVPWLWRLGLTTDSRIFQGHDGARDRGADLLRSGTHRLPPGADQDVRQPRVLRAVPGDGAGLRDPPAGGRGDLVLLPARGRQAHPGAGGRRLRPPGLPRPPRGGALPVRRARRDEHGRRRLLHLRAAGGGGQVRGGRLQLRDAVQRPGAGAGGGGGRRERQPLRVPRRLHPDHGGRAPGRDAPGEPPLGPHPPARGGAQPGLQRRAQLQLAGHERGPPIRSGCCTG